MSISEALTLDRKTMKYLGFVDLGTATPSNLKDVRADHALVFMFQPFRGQWVQVCNIYVTVNSYNRLFHVMTSHYMN